MSWNFDSIIDAIVKSSQKILGMRYSEKLCNVNLVKSGHAQTPLKTYPGYVEGEDNLVFHIYPREHKETNGGRYLREILRKASFQEN